MKRTLFLTILLLSISMTCYSQDTIAIRVIDKKEKFALPFASVQINDKFSTADSLGYILVYKDSLKSNYIIKASYPGYAAFSKTSKELNFSTIELIPDNQLSEVEIFGNRINYRNGANIINISKIQFTPSLFSSNDLVRQLQIIPGVKTGVEGTTDLIIRGGNGGQSIFLLDGMEVESNAHLLGMMSPISSTISQEVAVYKSGFSAKYNNRLSGYIDIKTKDFDKYNKAELNLSTLALDVFKKVNLANIVSITTLIRKSMIDGIVDLYHLRNEMKLNDAPLYAYQKNNTGFGDIYLKVANNNQKNIAFGLQYLGSYDFILDRGKVKQNKKFEQSSISNKWNNQSFQVFGNVHKGKYSSENSIQLKRNEYNINQIDATTIWKTDTTLYENKNLYNTINSAVIYKSHHTYEVKEKLNINFGGTLRQPSTKLASTLSAQDLPTIHTDSLLSATILNLYTSIDKTSNFLSYNFGVNFSKNINFLPVYAEPRAMIALTFGDDYRHKIFAGASRITQHENLVSDRPIGRYFKLFIPASSSLKPSISDEISIGYTYNRSKISLSLESFYKTQQNNYLPKEGQSQLLLPKDISNLDFGTNTTYGLETAIDYKLGNDVVYFTYTYSHSKLKFNGVNNGNSFENFYNRPHDFSIYYYMKELRKKWRANFGFTIKSGIPVTLYNEFYRDLTYLDLSKEYKGYTVSTSGSVYVDPRFGFILPNLNNFRFPIYHRLDANFIREYETKGRRSYLTVGFYNIYARKNPIIIEQESKIKTIKVGNVGVSVFDGFVYKLKSYFVFVPSISYNIHFN